MQRYHNLSAYSFPIIILMLFITVTGCRQVRFVYAANKLNTPMLEKKGDTRLNGSFSFGNAKSFGDSSKNKGVDVQGAWAISSHIGIMASHYSRREQDVFRPDINVFRNSPYSTVSYRRRSTEAGAGYFFTPKNELAFSVYGGVSFGEFRLSDVGFIDTATPYNRFFSAKVSRYFLQPGLLIAGKHGPRVELSARISGLRYSGIQTDYDAFDLSLYYLDGLYTRRLNIVVELSLTFQFRFPGVPGLAIEASGSSVFQGNALNMRFWNLSTGLTVNPTQLFKPQKAPAKKAG